MANFPFAQDLSKSEGAEKPDDFRDTGAFKTAQSGRFAQASFDDHDSDDSDLSSTDVRANRHLSALGQSLVFKGELTAEEDLLIQGRVEGSIQHNANSLTVGAHGDVKADIRGRNIIIQGKVQGDVFASESVVVEASARMRGKIVAPRVGIKEGAKFRGSIDMDFDASASSASSKSEGKSDSSSKSDSSASKVGPSTEAKELSDTAVDRVLKK